MAEKAGFEGEGEVEFRSPGKIRDARDEGFQETCRTCQDSNKTPKRHARDNEICVRPLKATAAMHGLVDLASMEEQKFYWTWMHARSKKWYQLDHMFVRQDDAHKVHKCINAEVVVDSDHYSVRARARYQKPRRGTKTVRRNRMNKDFSMD